MGPSNDSACLNLQVRHVLPPPPPPPLGEYTEPYWQVDPRFAVNLFLFNRYHLDTANSSLQEEHTRLCGTNHCQT